VINKISLKQIMQNLYENAIKFQGRSSSCTLSRGLRITLKVKDGFVKLYLSRSDVYPSLEEYKTILKSLPSAPMIFPPQRVDSRDISPAMERRFYFVAKWPKQEAIPMEIEQ
jgi:hypothetical protein